MCTPIWKDKTKQNKKSYEGSFADRKTAFWQSLAFGTHRAPEREKAKVPSLPPIRCKSVKQAQWAQAAQSREFAASSGGDGLC